MLARWASEDYRGKATFDVTTDAVAISTIHTAKGMDWSVVFVVDPDELEPPPQDLGAKPLFRREPELSPSQAS